jgi:AraC-like DNA-binding protein
MKTFKLETSYHSIIDNDNLIFIMGNNGLSVFEKSVERLHNNFIVDEFNSNAIFKSKSDLSLGSIHGIYKFENVNSLEKKSYFENIEENQSSERYLFYIVLIFFLFIITIILIIKNLKVKNLSNEQIIIEIKKYVENNLSTVSMLSLQEEFKLDYYALNNLQIEFSPAKYIKLKRNIKAKKLFQEKKDISKISKLTGYSESYLKKNKYLYLRL